MTDHTIPSWLAWTLEIQALSQSGLSSNRASAHLLRDVLAAHADDGRPMVFE